jgi:hypothetical protein
MSKRGVGFLLLLTAAIALGALVQDYRFDQLIAAEQAALSGFEQRVRDLEQSVIALGGSRRAALASGEMPADWLSRLDPSISEIDTTLTRERNMSGDAPTIAALDSASTAFAKFKRADSTGIVQDIQQGLATARIANRQRAEATLGQLGQLRLAMNAVAVIFTLAVALYLGRVATVLGVRASGSTTQMLRDLPPPVKTGATSPASAQITASGPPAPLPAPIAPHRPSGNLAATAELCVDLAKVLDADDVPSLLERAASVLDARGIVLWAIDADGARLRASLSYGYPDKVLSKLRPLQIDADNVTSLAFRSTQPQMMNGASPTDAAALAIPLLTGGGCVGVMAVELRHNRPHADLLPVARILGAQFSTLIAPTEEVRAAAKA